MVGGGGGGGTGKGEAKRRKITGPIHRNGLRKKKRKKKDSQLFSIDHL